MSIKPAAAHIGAPPAVGHYALKITESRIEGAGGAGLEFSNRQIVAAGRTETSKFDVVLRGNSISGNGPADLKLNAPAARIDARKNCWGNAQGLAEDRIQLFAPAQRTAGRSRSLALPQMRAELP